MERVELHVYTKRDLMNATKVYEIEKAEMLENYEVKIKELVYKGANKIYGNALPEEVEDRINKELKSIIENNFTILYIIAQKLVKKSNENGYIASYRGSIGSSLVAYFLGITEVDPLKYNIPFEVFAGFYGDRKPDIELNFAEEYLTKLQEYEKVVDDEIILKPLSSYSNNKNFLKIKILEQDILHILHKLQGLTGINPTTINLKDKETMKLMCSTDMFDIHNFETKFVRDIILETNPTTFDELIKINAIFFGTDIWKNNAQDLIKNGIATLREVIGSRDDIMNDLIKAGIEPKIAFEVMETVRKGKVRMNKEPNWKEYKRIMEKHHIPGWYIKSCEKIGYMFPKAHAVIYTINAFRIAYYKVHYPEAFQKVCLKESKKNENRI